MPFCLRSGRRHTWAAGTSLFRLPSRRDGGEQLSDTATLQSCKGSPYILSIIKAGIYLSTSTQRSSQPRCASGASSPRQHSDPDRAGAGRSAPPFSRGLPAEPQLPPGTAPLLPAACVGAVTRAEPTRTSRQRGVLGGWGVTGPPKGRLPAARQQGHKST